MNPRVVLGRARRAAEALMRDSCRVTRAGDGERVFDDYTGQYVDPARVVVFEGSCRVQVPTLIADVVEASAGDRSWTLQGVVVALPVVGSVGVRVGDEVEVLSSSDPELVGRVFRVAGLHHKSDASSRRLRCEEVTG